MIRVKQKSVYSPIDRKNDGLRLLVTRIRGHGLRSSRYHVWMASLAPSEELLQAWREGRITSWSEFRKRYKHQLRESESTDKANKNIKNHGQKFTLRLLRELAKRQTITLLCHCREDESECHRHILKEILRRAIK